MAYVLWVPLFIILLFWALTWISKRINRLISTEVADIIEKHIQGTEGPWDWDEFTSIPIADKQLDRIRLRCIQVGDILTKENTEELVRFVEELRRNN